MWTFALIRPPQQSRCWWGMMTSVWVARLFVRPWRLVRRKVDVYLFVLKLKIANCEPFYRTGKYWCGSEKQIGQSTVLLCIYFFFIETVRKWRKAQDKMFWRNLIHYGNMWSQRRRCTPSLSEIKIDFFVFSVLSDRLHSDDSESLVWWITEKETERLHFWTFLAGDWFVSIDSSVHSRLRLFYSCYFYIGLSIRVIYSVYTELFTLLKWRLIQ